MAFFVNRKGFAWLSRMRVGHNAKLLQQTISAPQLYFVFLICQCVLHCNLLLLFNRGKNQLLSLLTIELSQQQKRQFNWKHLHACLFGLKIGLYPLLEMRYQRVEVFPVLSFRICVCLRRNSGWSFSANRPIITDARIIGGGPIKE